MNTSLYEIQRRADFARARSLAEQGFIEMAKAILKTYLPAELPQCVVEVNSSRDVVRR